MFDLESHPIVVHREPTRDEFAKCSTLRLKLAINLSIIADFGEFRTIITVLIDIQEDIYFYLVKPQQLQPPSQPSPGSTRRMESRRILEAIRRF